MRMMLLMLSIVLAPGVAVAEVAHPAGPPASALTRPDSRRAWPKIALPSPDEVAMRGVLGTALGRGVHRLAEAPYTTDWLLADVSFKVDRIFTNYSGDVSGRFLELATLTSPPGRLQPASTLPAFLRSVTQYQKPDGHFGVAVDYSKPLQRGSRGITLLWGNARMLVGLVTASRKLHDPSFLESAKKLGDFYIRTAGQLCDPARSAEYHATGTAADSYQVCYFPAMEGLVMLYEDTHDQRYLDLAERMAKFFLGFDILPDDHSHGNLSAWRSILDLYRVTGKPAYLEEAIAKWNKAVDGGFVWPIGGVGEHFYVSYNASEGCSESDWLRLNLELWRYTGQPRYLDIAGRLLRNQYVADQAANGGFGMRHFDGPASGPIATFGDVNEWDFCCSFHGPLGLYFLKSYLAAAAGNDIYINFPFDFSSQVSAGGTSWRIDVQTDPAFDRADDKQMTIRLAPGKPPTSQAIIHLRAPHWCSQVFINGSKTPAQVVDGYVTLARYLHAGAEYKITFKTGIEVEGRRFASVAVDPEEISRLKDVSMVLGSRLLFQTPARGPQPSALLAIIDADGKLDLLRNSDDDYASVVLPDVDATREQIVDALQNGRKVSLLTWPVPTTRRAAFGYDLVVVPAEMISPSQRREFAARPLESQVPHYGDNLEKQPDLWPSGPQWQFQPDGILITGGDVGLIEGRGYKDYQFEFDVTLPLVGQGITGWIVRAKDELDCMMFQLQSADTQYNDPRYKTRPNTLRPIPRRGGAWEVEDPIALPKTIHKGGTYHVATECRGGQITVFLDGQKIYEGRDDAMQSGAVGFRVGEPLDQGLFSHIKLKKL